MEFIKVRSLKQHDYDHKPRKRGELYDCDERFVEALKWTGNIEVVQESEPERAGKYKRRDMRAGA